MKLILIVIDFLELLHLMQKHAAGSWVHSKVGFEYEKISHLELVYRKNLQNAKVTESKKREDQGKSPLELHRRLADDFQ